MQLLEKMYLNPAKLYHLPTEGIREGAPADLVIFNENETFTVGDFASRAVNSPFTGWTLYAPVHYTICGGEIVYERGSRAGA
jgi:dihydroorotase